MEFAQHDFTLSQKSGGSSLREHLESVQRQTGKRPAELDGPPLPPEGAHWWYWWLSLAEGRGYSASGVPLPFTWADLRGWAELSRLELGPPDIDALRAIDRVYLKTAYDQRAAEAAQRKRSTQ